MTNTAPTFGTVSTLDGHPAYAVGESPIILDADVQIEDAEFDLSGSYDGATLTLERHGGASTDDRFSHRGLEPAIGATLHDVLGNPVATVVENGAGRLVLEFMSSPTQSQVSLLMQQIGYANTGSTTGPVQIDWTFADNDPVDPLTATGSTTVDVTAPVIDTLPPIVTSITVDQASTTTEHILHYTFTFSEAVGNVDLYDFYLSNAGSMSGLSITDVVSQSGNAFDTDWIVTVDAGLDPGFVRVLLGTGITDLAGNNLASPWRMDSTTSSSDGRAPENIAGPAYVAIGDIDGDGDLDVVTSNPNDNRAAVLLNDGSGYYTQSAIYDIDGAPFGQGEAYALGGGSPPYATPADLTLADLDGDGDLDMVVSVLDHITTADTASHSGVAIRWNDGTGHFGGAYDYYEGVGEGPRRVVAGDLNGDGNADLAVANSYDGTISIMLSDGAGGFIDGGSGTFPLYSAGTGGVFDIKLGDADGDGTLDIIGTGGSSAFVLAGQGDGTFDAAVSTIDHTTGTTRSIDVGDIDGDGDLDAVTVNDVANNVTVLLGNGDGTFAIGPNYATGNPPWGIDLGDLNGDGRLDMAIANRLGDSVSVWHGVGDGTFTPWGDAYGTEPAVPTGSYPFDVAIADMNGDGTADIVTPAYRSTQVYTLLGAPGAYTSPVVTIISNTPPVAVDDTATTDEDTNVVIDVLANDSNAEDGTPLPGTVTDAYGAAHGTLTISLFGSIIYTPNADFFGTDSFTYEVTDSLGARAAATVDVTVEPVNDAPVLGLGGGTVAYTENDPAVAIAPDLSISDVDSPMLLGATVTISANLAVLEDQLVVTPVGGIAASYDSGTGTLTLLGEASLAEYQVTLRSVAYRNTSESPSTAPRSLSFQVDDGATLHNLSNVGDVTVAVTARNDAPQGAVTLASTGTIPTEHDVLTAVTGTITDADGLGEFQYQWQRSPTLTGPFSDIAGAMNSTYRIEDGDSRAFVRVVVTYTDRGGTLETLTSFPTGPVLPVNDEPTGNVVVLGDPIEDAVLTADTSGLHDDDGIGSFQYQWERGDGTAFGIVLDATQSTYQLTDADVGKQLRVQVSYVDGGNTYEIVRSMPTVAVGNINDPPAGTLAINGFRSEHEQLSVDIGVITDGDGMGSGTLQWQRAEGAAGTFTDIPGATNWQYTTGDADAARYLRAVYRYTDGHGTQEVVTTAPALINNVPDAPIAAAVAASGDEDTVVSVTLTGSDVDPGDFVQQFRLISLPFGGTLHLLDPNTATGPNPALTEGDYAATGGALTLYFRPEQNYSNVVTFQYRAVDTQGVTSSIQEAQITLNPVNDAPTIITPLQDRSFGGNQFVSFQVPSDAFQDVDHATLSYAATLRDGSALPDWLSFNPISRSFAGTPPSNTSQDLEIRVTATDPLGLQAFDDFVLHITHVNSAPAGAVAIQPGTAREDDVLTVDTSGLSDADGLGTFSYQWQKLYGSMFTAIDGATGESYALGQADVGGQFRVALTYTDGAGTPETVTSSPTSPILNVNDLPAGSLVVNGTPLEDQPLTVDTLDISDDDGIAATSRTLQWQIRIGSSFSDLPGETGTTYTPGDDAADRDIRVAYRYVDGYGQLEQVFSDPVHVANINDAPGGSFAIGLGGFFPIVRAFEGQTYAVNPATITDADGLGSGTVQWQRGSAGVFIDVPSDPNSLLSYTTGDADAGQYLRAVYRYTDGHGTQETVITQALLVENVNDAPTGFTARIVGALENEPFNLVLDGSIQDADGGAGPLGYQWARRIVTSSGEQLIDIPGANGASFTPTYQPLSGFDGRESLRLRISYTDGFGTPETIDVYSDQVLPVNDGPVLSGFPEHVAYVEGAPAVVLAPTASVSDEEFDARNSGLGDYRGSTLVVTPTAITLDDHFGFAPMPNIAVRNSSFPGIQELVVAGNVIATAGIVSGAFNIGFGSSFTGVSTKALLQEIVRAITYENRSDTPPASLELTFELYDLFSQGGSPIAQVTVDITAVNDPPTIAFPRPTPGGGTYDVPEGSTLAADLNAFDPENLQREGQGLRYEIVGGADADKLDIDSGTGVLTFRTAPDYESPDDAGGDGVYDIRVRVAEDAGAGAASEANIELHIVDMNIPLADPAVAIGLENEAILITLVGRNLDTNQPIDTFRLLALPEHGTLYLDPVLRTPAATVNVNTDYPATGDALRLYFVSEGEFAGSMQFAFTATSGTETTQPQTATIHISGVNDAPVLANVGTTEYIEGGAAARLFASAILSDAEHDALNGGLGNYSGLSIVLAAPESATAVPEHIFDLAAMANVAVEGSHINGTRTLRSGDQIFGIITGNQIYFDSALASTYGGTGTLPTRALVNEVVQAITYANALDNPPATVSIGYAITDRLVSNVAVGGPATTSGAVTVHIEATNDAPEVGLVSGPVPYTENSLPVVLAPALTITDIDSTTLLGAVVSISGGLVASEDLLVVTPQGGISVSYDAGTGELTLLGEASLDDYQATLRSVAYVNGSENPSTAPRTISFQVDDGETLHNLSNVAGVTVDVIAVNDLPTGTVNIAGLAQQDANLTASNTLSDAEGLGAVSYSWLRDGVATGVAGPAYTLTEIDVGAQISVEAAYIDGRGTTERVLSSSTSVITGNGDALATGGDLLTFAVNGRGIRQTVTLSDTAIFDRDLLTSSNPQGQATPSYQWQHSTNGADWTDVAGATAASFTPSGIYLDRAVRVVATYDDAFGTHDVISQAAEIGNFSANTLQGTAGADLLVGLTGNDVYYVDNVGDRVIEADTGGNGDSVRTLLGTYTLAANLENLALLGGATNASVEWSGNDLSNNITSGDGNDTLHGGAGNDSLNANGGSDFLDGGAGNDSMNGGAGTDTALFNEALADHTFARVRGNIVVQSATDGRDTLIGIEHVKFETETYNLVVGTAAADILEASSSADLFLGFGGNDTVSYVTSAGDLTVSLLVPTQNSGDAAGDVYDRISNLIGGGGDDWLSGDGAANSLSGGDGNDTIVGGAGRDVLTGGAGGDTFQFALGFGRDVITDFQFDTSNTGVHDLLDLRGLGFNSVEQVLLHTTGGSSAVIHVGGDAITLIGVSKLQLQSHLDHVLVL